MMELIKNDIAHVISKYMKIDATSMDIQIMKTGTNGRSTKTPVLYANIPIVNIKNEQLNEFQNLVLSVNSYNLDKKLNKVWIVDGREPRLPNEMLVDASVDKFGYELGDTIRIKHENIKDQDYVIVGFVRSPYFISIER